MTLWIHDRKTGESHEYHYNDACIDGNIVYLNRNRDNHQTVWNREDVAIDASEGDHIYSRNKDGSWTTVR